MNLGNTVNQKSSEPYFKQAFPRVTVTVATTASQVSEVDKLSTATENFCPKMEMPTPLKV